MSWMWNKIIVILIFFTFSQFVSAENIDNEIIRMDGYKNYHNLVLKANVLKANNDYNAAIKLYDSAFSLAYPFPEDMLERLECYELSGKTDKIPNALIELVQHGYKFRENSPIFGSEPIFLRKIPLKDDYISSFANTYDSLRTKITHAQDFDANDIMHFFRTYANSLSNIKAVMNSDSLSPFQAYIKNLVGCEKTILSLEPAYKSTFQDFIDIVDYSISEELISLFKDTTYDLSRQHSDFWDDPYWNLSILSALRGASTDSIKLKELHLLLQEQINRGNFHPNTYSYICKLLADSIKRNIVSVSEFMPDKFSIINPIFKIKVDTVEVEKNNYPQYYELTNKAITYFVQDSFYNAAKCYEQAFEIAYPFEGDLYNLLECYNKLNMPEKEYEILQRLVLCGFEFISDCKVLEYRPNYKKVKNSASFLKTSPELIEKLKLEYDSLRSVYLSKIDIEISRYLTTAIALDKLLSITRFNPKIRDQLGYFIVNFFESNISREKSIGRKWNDLYFASSLLWGVRSFEPYPIYDIYMDTLIFNSIFEHVILGNISPRLYSILYDNSFTCQGRYCSTTYGANYWRKRKLMDIKCVKYVDNLRTQIYLPPLWVECKMTHYKLPKGYKYKEVEHK